MSCPRFLCLQSLLKMQGLAASAAGIHPHLTDAWLPCSLDTGVEVVQELTRLPSPSSRDSLGHPHLAALSESQLRGLAENSLKEISPSYAQEQQREA